MQNEVGKGSFQELDQVAAVAPFVKYAGRARSVGEISAVITSAAQVSPSSSILSGYRV